MEKITRKSVLNKVIANEDIFTAEEIAVAEKMIASLDKKSAKSGKPTKRQVETEDIKVRIREFLDTVDRATATEIGNAVDVSCQRASALLKQMGVAKVVEKGKSYYSTSATNEGEDE